MKYAASVSLAAMALAACSTVQPAPAPVAAAEAAQPPANTGPALTPEGARELVAMVD
jgi:hypothetical protein